MNLPALAVVIPSYRHGIHIKAVLDKIPTYVTHIVVVDDCSPDHTRDVVVSSPDPRVVLISHSENQGVGGAVLSGYEAALGLNAEIIVKMDSDEQMDPAYLMPLITPILTEEADYTKGNRFLHARELKDMPWIRRIGNIMLSFLTKAASGYWNIFDPTNGYTAIHRSVISQLDRGAISRRYFFESSMLIELGILRAVVRDVFIPARYGDEVSTLSKRSALVEFPWRLVRGFCRRLWVQYFVRDFGIFSVFFVAGAIMLLFGSVFGLYHWIHSALLGVVTPTGTIMVAVLPVILGIQLLLQSIVLDIQNVPNQPLHQKPPLSSNLQQQRRGMNGPQGEEVRNSK
jgi:glycosyltransferase involved in cell wall biosynthesis